MEYGEQLQEQNCISSFSAVEDELEEDEEKVEGLPDDIHIQEYEDVDAGPMKASGNNLFFGITEPESPEAQNMENEDELDYENNSNSANGHSRSEPIRSILVKLDSGVIKRLYRCNHCDQVFDSVRHCVKHMTTSHQTNRKYRVAYRCKTCGKLFRTKYGCENHIQGKHKNRTIRCRYCDFETSSVTYIKKHERNHLDDFEIRCDLCNKGFASKTVLERHMISHTGEKPFVCEKCNASYADKRSLTLHMTVHDPEGRPKRYTCDQCDYSSFWKNAVKTHMKVHTGAKVICDECGQAVASNYYLKIHKRIHSDEKPFTCDVCNKGFRQMKNLVVHRRTHTKVKPYKCHACDKSFSQNVWLKKHKCRSNSAAENHHVEVGGPAGNEAEMAEAEVDMDPDNIESINDNFQREKSAKSTEGGRQKPKQRGRWTEAGMQAAVSAILAKKMTLRKASLYFAVPKSTLASRMKSIQAGEQVDLAPQIGSFQKALCQRLESQLIARLKEQEARFLPLHKREFLKLAYDLAEHLQLPHKFNRSNKTAGKKFYYDFTLRHPELSVIADPSLTSPKTSAPISKTQVDQFFKVYQELVDRLGLSPGQIHSCEETSVLIHHRDIRRNVNVCKLTPSERGTVLLSVNAAGDCFAPPLFVFPGQEPLDESYRRNCPLGSVFSVEESGCVSTESFLEYLRVLVELQAPSEQRPLLLLVNARPYHNDLKVIHFAKLHHVHLLGLPQHSAHILHPLERALMQTFGAAYIEACKKWIKCCQPAQLAPRDVAGLVNEAYCSIFRKDLAQYAFRCTGLWPINPHAIVGLDYGDDMDDVFDDSIASAAPASSDDLMSIPTVDVAQQQEPLQQQQLPPERTSCCSTTTSTTPSTTATTPTSPTLSDLFRSSTSSLQSYLPSASVIRRVDEAANEASTSSLDDFVLKAVESVAGFSVIRRIHSGEESNFDVNI
ncbi:unnamed protein product [Trichogramma brassicae]|uniref:C2H2-type domain-containing protein n=1 Tax=Trichogramma brassicae TaxID=86971 RepID=A0A6H5JAE5_9HYME|nr:unnamed protein product [Trichogramma brassicae]